MLHMVVVAITLRYVLLKIMFHVLPKKGSDCKINATKISF